MLNEPMISSSRFSNRPLYLQLRDALAERIANGEWKPTAAIPNESDLAREFDAAALAVGGPCADGAGEGCVLVSALLAASRKRELPSV